MEIQAEPLRRLVASIFRALRSPDEEAAYIGQRLVSANLYGHDSHGVVRVPRYAEWVRIGHLVPGQEPEVIIDNPTMALLDGRRGFGQSVGTRAVQIGIDKAKAGGLSLIGLRNVGHLGRIGDWGEMAAAAGLVAIHFVNVGGSQLVAPFGGVDRRMGTNPVVIAVPRPGEEPLLLDFATSLVAEGKVLVAARGGKAVSNGSLIGPDGSLSADPGLLYGADNLKNGVFNPMLGPGALRTMGEHKGSGLSFMCEILAGALTGSPCAGPGNQLAVNGMLSIYMAPGFFGSTHDFAAMTREYIEFFKSSRPATAGGEVLMPGEPERRTRDARLVKGVPLSDEVWRAILATARDVGVPNSQLADVPPG